MVTNGVHIPLLASYITDNQRCTALSNHGETVRTVEHLLAALYSAKIDNVLIELEGIEIPILDGSAFQFLEAVDEAGTPDTRRGVIGKAKCIS